MLMRVTRHDACRSSLSLPHPSDRRAALGIARRAALAGLASLGIACALVAQNGDRKGEVQGDLPPELRLPKAPPLSPADALKAFEVAPGYRVELAAAEPELVDPVQVCFDADGQLWVVEMRGFMPDADGKGEREKIGRIAVLRDEDGDGRFETRRDFLSELVLPRGVLPYRDGVLVILPPKLIFVRDTDGDGVGDTREVVLDKGFEAGFDNPEHAGNAPTLGHDEWIYLANFGKRLCRGKDGKWQIERTHKRGQWGLSQDDWGRQVYNYNSSFLHGDRFSSHYSAQNPAIGFAAANERIVTDEKVYSIRPNPGINRGYHKNMLKADCKLARTTATCGPGVYRGGLFAPEVVGDIFIPEPAGNLVRHARVQEDDAGKRRATNAWGQREFLASKDERFRPVQCLTGPDGALYIVDLYRGILQHRRFLTTFLRKQIEDRGLDKPVGLGRLWRVVPEGAKRAAAPRLASAAPAALCKALASPNGVVRELAQSVLVKRGIDKADAATLQALRAQMGDAENAHARYHATWTAAHCELLTTADVQKMLGDPHPKLRALAIRLAESRPEVSLGAVLEDASPEVRLQLALTLSQSKDGPRLDLLAGLLERFGDERILRQAALSGLAGRESDFAKFLSTRNAWKDAPDGGSALFRRFAQAITKRRRAADVLGVLEMAAGLSIAWQRDALLRGCTEGLPRGKARKGSIRAKAKSDVLSRLATQGCNEKRIAQMREAIVWPGATAVSSADARPLTKTEQRLVRLGKHYFKAHCVQCHQEDGRGQAGLAPSLHDSEIVLGPASRQVRVVLHGLTGPVEIAGKKQVLTMEPLGAKLNDRQIAAILTFTRRSWGHRAKPVSPSEVQAVRRATSARKQPWKREELFKIE